MKQESSGVCSESVVFCGLRDRLYPDLRPMGFPFDRPANFDIATVDDFIRGRANMFNRTVSIKHIPEVLKELSIKNLNVSEGAVPAAGAPAPTATPGTPAPNAEPTKAQGAAADPPPQP